MAEQQKFLTTTSLTPGKLIVIGVLSVVFVVVLVMNFSGSSSQAKSEPVAGGSSRPSPPRRRSPGRRAVPNPGTTSKDGEIFRVEKKLWSQFSLKQIGSFNPFALPQIIAAKIVSNQEAKSQGDKDAKLALERKYENQLRVRRDRDAFLQSLRTDAAILIVHVNNRRIAMIGERKIAVGDVLPEGFRVTGINDNGLILDEVEVVASQQGGSGNGDKEQ